MTFLKYSRLTSSSFDCAGVDGAGEPTRDGGSDVTEDIEVRVSGGPSFVREVQ